jgi:type II secretory pathway component PulF
LADEEERKERSIVNASTNKSASMQARQGKTTIASVDEEGEDPKGPHKKNKNCGACECTVF